MSERETEIRATLARLDEAAHSDKPLSPDDLATLRRQLEDATVSLREQQDKSKQVHDENDLLSRRRDELEQRLSTLEQEYEELLGTWISALCVCTSPHSKLLHLQTRPSPRRSAPTPPTCRTSGCASFVR